MSAIDHFLSLSNNFSSPSSSSSYPVTQNPFGPYPQPAFYYVPRSTFLPSSWSISDLALSLASPIVAYWSLSIFFHILDVLAPTHPSIEKYKLHESKEVTKRNLATKWDVVKAIIQQQVVQSVVGLYWVSEPEGELQFYTGGSKGYEDAMRWWAGWIVRASVTLFGQETAQSILSARGADIVWCVYWWVWPVAQFFLAMFIIDTHQYMLHRLMHVNKFLYKRVHSVHHRLYVPYAFGALYNHPVEGFLLDTLGALLAHTLTGMTTRQAALLFGIATLKTVDDHCGYSFPWDPLQVCFGNNADYHDIHHQVIGIKSNFSQPFFIHWDVLCGTRMTREEIETKKADRAARAKLIAEARIASGGKKSDEKQQREMENMDDSDSGVDVNADTDEKVKLD